MSLEKKLAQHLKQTKDLKRVNFTVKILIDHMSDLCKRCQSDRIICSLRPLCNREYLNLLIDANVEERVYPDFCYKLQKQEVAAFLQGKSTIKPMLDIKLGKLAFLEILFGKKIARDLGKKGVDEFIEKVREKMETLFGETKATICDKFIFWITKKNYYIFRFDREKQIFSINMDSELFGSAEEVERVTSLLCELNKLDCKLFNTSEGLLYAKIILPVNEKLDKKELVRFINEFKKDVAPMAEFLNIVERVEHEKRKIVIMISLFDESEDIERLITPTILKNIFFRIDTFAKNISIRENK
ncbi:MAG: hypothetical protein ACP6IS_01980 [Candidatus Asgardarchaeia archaeon]